MYQPSELRAFLEMQGIRADRRLSQNFLVDGNIVRKMIDFGEVSSNDTVLEIGPGPGALTQELLRRGARVIAVEKDAQLAEALQRLQTDDQRLTVLSTDFLDLSLQETLPRTGRVKVIANLPYSITTPILEHLLGAQELLDSITVLVQKEVAERMSAMAGSKVFGSLSVLLQFWSDVHYAFTVSPHCFYPKPKVSSAVVQLLLHQPLLPYSEQRSFFRLTRHAFNHRRKMLRRSLREFFTQHVVEEALKSCGFSITARPEDLSVVNWVSLYAKLPAASG